MKKKDRTLLILIVISIVVMVAGLLITKNSNKEPDYSKMTEEEQIEALNENIDKMGVTELNEMTERERIERYIGEFLEAIRNEKYESAYGMLYIDFKDRYFQTLDDFKNYVNANFSNRVSVECTNIERNGDIYVLWVNITNPLKSKSEAREINFVIQENDLDDFKLSFSL